MEGFAGDQADGGFLDAEFGGVRGKVVWDHSEIGVVTQHTPRLGSVAQFVVEAAALSRTRAAKQRKAAQHQRKSPKTQNTHLLCYCICSSYCPDGFESVNHAAHAASLCLSQTLSARSAPNPQIKGIEQIRGRTWGIFIYTIIPSWKPIGCVLVFCIYTEQTFLF